MRCNCGDLEGVARGLSPDAGLRVVCYCDDCQAFAHHLGCADHVLDSSGGTEIFQLSPARLQFQTGALACLRLTPGGMIRWYAPCCSAPIGNTFATGRLPFVGLITSILDTDEPPLGPVLARVQVKFATGEVTGKTFPQAPPRLVAKLMGRIAIGSVRGEQRRSPFFDRQSLEPVVPPHVLTTVERASLPGG